MDRRAEIEARLAAARAYPVTDGAEWRQGVEDVAWLLNELARVERERDVAVEATQPGAVTFFIDEALRLESMLHDLARRVVEDDDPMTMARDLIANTGGLSTRMVSEGVCVTTSGWVPRLIAEQFFLAFDEYGAVNNIEWSISHKGRHATITAQIRGGATPSEQRDAARADVARLERELAEARADAARSAAAAVAEECDRCNAICYAKAEQSLNSFKNRKGDDEGSHLMVRAILLDVCRQIQSRREK